MSVLLDAIRSINEQIELLLSNNEPLDYGKLKSLRARRDFLEHSQIMALSGREPDETD